MLCNICHLGEATIHPVFGILPCTKCQAKHKLLRGPSSLVEFTSEDIKLQRKAYREDFIPMHNNKGLEKSWLDRYGKKKASQHGFTESEIRHATYGWDGVDEFYKHHA